VGSAVRLLPAPRPVLAVEDGAEQVAED
jgi:hypothetical protein